MSRADITLAVSTVWVVIAACLVIFMQAGFALLETGLTRMKNVSHVAVKTVISLAVVSCCYWLYGFGISFSDGGPILGTHGFAPGVGTLLAVGKAPYTFFSGIPASAGMLFEVAFAAASLAICWGAMAERAKLWVYPAFGCFFTLTYSIVSHWIWHSSGWLFGLGMQDFAGSTVVHLQGALGGLAGALILGPRIGKYGRDRRPRAIPGHNMLYATLGTLVLWFGWFGFNAGSTLGVSSGGRVGFFAQVALITNLAAACGAIGGLAASLARSRTADTSMILNGVLAALVAITAASGFVDMWAGALIGLVAGTLPVIFVPLIERIGIDDPIGATATHGIAGIWGTIATGLFASPKLAALLATGSGGLVYTASLHQVGVQLLGVATVAAFTFGTSFGFLYLLDRAWGIRVSVHAEHEGLDISEHGMWGYPEMFIPVPDGYSGQHPGGAPNATLIVTPEPVTADAA